MALKKSMSVRISLAVFALAIVLMNVREDRTTSPSASAFLHRNSVRSALVASALQFWAWMRYALLISVQLAQLDDSSLLFAQCDIVRWVFRTYDRGEKET